jgi:hypothetical protein
MQLNSVVGPNNISLYDKVGMVDPLWLMCAPKNAKKQLRGGPVFSNICHVFFLFFSFLFFSLSFEYFMTFNNFNLLKVSLVSQLYILLRLNGINITLLSAV